MLVVTCRHIVIGYFDRDATLVEGGRRTRENMSVKLSLMGSRPRFAFSQSLSKPVRPCVDLQSWTFGDVADRPMSSIECDVILGDDDERPNFGSLTEVLQELTI